jgi:hypothetical protein
MPGAEFGLALLTLYSVLLIGHCATGCAGSARQQAMLHAVFALATLLGAKVCCLKCVALCC